jgi:GNAT superfamily N-acetyltransferase
VQISHIKYFQNWIPIISRWIHEEWSYVHPQKGLLDIQKEMCGRVKENEMPITLVAHDERGVMGTASLKATDIDALKELTPWLSSVYVQPEHRGQGIAHALAAEIEKSALKLRFRKLYLFNPISQGVYEELGWKVCQQLEYGGKQLAILVKNLDEGGPSG